ncbi:hypothetical protein OF829_03175 [Sphingomonas sp. LB-2]|uniref:hypothetical protein n=1 Tax=Sphingomonas caeni TaxID=2984949 RepID=UPI0022327D7A|nr:hypothetical protein [Sphingomonas caeni]MCW3846226.1 hypothetical protein [Sphingomonas caeni]
MNEGAWFVRYGSGFFISLQPSGLMGWLITLGYAVLVTVIATFAAVRRDPHWYLWAIAIAALTTVFVVTAYRNSIPAETRSGGNDN